MYFQIKKKDRQRISHLRLIRKPINLQRPSLNNTLSQHSQHHITTSKDKDKGKAHQSSKHILELLKRAQIKKQHHHEKLTTVDFQLRSEENVKILNSGHGKNRTFLSMMRRKEESRTKNLLERLSQESNSVSIMELHEKWSELGKNNGENSKSRGEKIREIRRHLWRSHGNSGAMRSKTEGCSNQKKQNLFG